MSPNCKYCGILLAAGTSSRMDEWKPGIEIHGRPLIYYPLDLLIEVCDEVIVVGGYNYLKMVTLINSFEESALRIKVVENINYKKGMFSSVQYGLTFVSADIKGVFILPADIPFVKKATCEILKNEFKENDISDVYIPSIILKNDSEVIEIKGHPVLFKHNVIDYIRNYDTSKTLRDVIGKLTVHLVPVNDKGILFDIDDKTDLKKIDKFIN